jgi:hypothetical protein
MAGILPTRNPQTAAVIGARSDARADPHAGPRETLTNGLRCEYVRIDSLVAASLRKHPKKQLRKLETSFDAFGQVRPILITAQREIIDGHGFVEVMKSRGCAEVAAIVVDHLSPDEITALKCVLNRSAADGRWDKAQVGKALCELQDRGTALELTGFDTIEIETALDLGARAVPVFNEIELTPMKLPISVVAPGEIYELGAHRIGCGNPTDLGFLNRLIRNKPISAVFIDVPTDVGADVGAGDEGDAAGVFAERLMAVGSYLAPTAIAFVKIDWRQYAAIAAALAATDFEERDLCVIAKPLSDDGGFYRSEHRFILVLERRRRRHPGAHSSSMRSNLWVPTQGRSKGKSPPNYLAHITRAITDVTEAKAAVFDPYVGKGQVLIAAEASDRMFIGVSMNAFDVEDAILRWQTHTGLEAFNTVTRETFAAAQERHLASFVRAPAMPAETANICIKDMK